MNNTNNIIDLQKKREEKGLPPYINKYIDGQSIFLPAYNKWLENKRVNPYLAENKKVNSKNKKEAFYSKPLFCAGSLKK